MSPSDATPIVLDTSILLNFAKVGHVRLLGKLGVPLLLLDQVLVEIIHAEQRAAVDEAIAAGTFDLQSVTDLAEVTLFAELRSSGRFGAGECAVIAVALTRNLVAGLQDKQARAEASRRLSTVRLCQTEDLVRLLLRGGFLTLDAADQLLVEWAAKHRFKSKLTSFKNTS